MKTHTTRFASGAIGRFLTREIFLAPRFLFPFSCLLFPAYSLCFVLKIVVNQKIVVNLDGKLGDIFWKAQSIKFGQEVLRIK